MNVISHQPSVSPMDTQSYLKRIGYTGALAPTDEVLADLHRKHVFQIPFENVDVYYKRRFGLDPDNIHRKVVIDKRGGFCYELNLLFNGLLQSVGFSSRIIACRIIDEDGILGPEYDHMAVYVETGKKFLVDVGYGDLFVTPLEIKSGVQWDGRNYFRIEAENDREFLLSISSDGITYVKRYAFRLAAVHAADFAAICLDKQTNPSSYFVRNLVCTKPTETGRLTIFNDTFVERNGNQKLVSPIQNDPELMMYLRDKFGIKVR